jgi:hypothetical protein
MRNFLSKICRENQDTLVLFSSFFVRNRAFCDLISKNLVDPERPLLATWRRVACWISKATRLQAYASARVPTNARTPTSTHTYFSVCVSRRQRAAILSFSASMSPPYFSSLSYKQRYFRKGVIEHKMCVLIIFTTFVWKIFRSKKNSARYCHKCEKSSCKVPAILVGF